MKTEQIIIRVSEVDKKLWSEAAAKRGMSLSEYIRYTINKQLEQK